jgi:hypothetical protein
VGDKEEPTPLIRRRRSWRRRARWAGTGARDGLRAGPHLREAQYIKSTDQQAQSKQYLGDARARLAYSGCLLPSSAPTSLFSPLRFSSPRRLHHFHLGGSGLPLPFSHLPRPPPSPLPQATPHPAPAPATTNPAPSGGNGGPSRLFVVVGRGRRPGCVRPRGMGKGAGEAQPPYGAGGSGDGSCCCGGLRAVRLQCVAALLLGLAVLLSAVFWLPPFTGRGTGEEGPDPGDELGGACVGIARSRLAFKSGSRVCVCACACARRVVHVCLICAQFVHS